VALFMTAIPVSGVLSGAVSGWILTRMSSLGGLRGWQWLYLMEGLPSVLAGLACILFLDSSAAEAKWLTREQKDLLAKNLADEDALKRGSSHILDAFRNPSVWVLCAVYFGFVMASYGIGFWLPQMIADSVTKDPLRISLLSMIPWGVGAITMVIAGHHSDVTGERCWHIAIAGFVGAVAFALSATPNLPGAMVLAALTIANAGVVTTVSTFWSLPTGILSSTAAAAGIAWINSVGNLAGYFSPYLVGKVRDATHSGVIPLLMFAASCLVSAVIVLTLRRAMTMHSSADLKAPAIAGAERR